jgi:hypothetical protein
LHERGWTISLFQGWIPEHKSKTRSIAEAGWKAASQKVIVLYAKWIELVKLFVSKAGHEKPCLKLGGPSSKAKYAVMTDSASVPWGKGEKNPQRGVKENMKPRAYKPW